MVELKQSYRSRGRALKLKKLAHRVADENRSINICSAALRSLFAWPSSNDGDERKAAVALLAYEVCRSEASYTIRTQ